MSSRREASETIRPDIWEIEVGRGRSDGRAGWTNEGECGFGSTDDDGRPVEARVRMVYPPDVMRH